MKKGRNRIDWTGTTFGQLVAVESLGAASSDDRLWLCRCSCGNNRTVRIRCLLRKKHPVSACRDCTLKKMHIVSTKHGQWDSPTYWSWADMKDRCRNPKNKRYYDYGGRGIDFDPAWVDFTAFYKDMGDRPEGKSLDRRNNDKGYSKDNCKWSTPKEQMRNRRNSRLLTFRGKTQCCCGMVR